MFFYVLEFLPIYLNENKMKQMLYYVKHTEQ